MSQYSTISSHEPAFHPVPNYPGVISDSKLRHLGLGIVEELKLLCCTICERIRLLQLPTIHKHIHDHNIIDNRVFTTKKIQDTLGSYDIYTGYLPDFPRPNEPAIPYKALPTKEGFICRLCEIENIQAYLFSNSNLDNHFRQKHEGTLGQPLSHTRPAKFQTFCTGYNNGNLFFEVTDAPNYDLLSQPEDTTEVEQYITHQRSANEMAAALAQEYRPVYVSVSAGDSLKESHHTLFYTGWSMHVANRDSAFLVGLVTLCSKDDPLFRIANAAKRTFDRAQELIQAAPEPLCLAIKDDGSGGNLKPMTTLDKDARKEYTRTLQRWCVFIVRLYRLYVAKDDRYPITLGANQQDVCQCVERYCNNSDEYAGSEMVLQLAHAFWAPGSLQEFSHLIKDKMNDPTARFAALINLHEDGTFQSPRNISHNVVQLKYIIRSLLLLWADIQRQRDIAERRSQMASASQQDDPLAEVMLNIAKFISKRYVTPFSNICTVVSIASKYAASSIRPPNVNWLDLDTVIVAGQQVHLPTFGAAAVRQVERARDHIMTKVLLGMTLEELKFNVTEDTHIYDDLSRTDAGYCMFVDPRNPFPGMILRLAEKAFELRPGVLATGMHVNHEGKLRISWNDEGALRWLRNYHRAVEDMSVLTFLLGGQCPRGAEHCTAKLSNMPYRQRNYFCPSPGVIAEVLMYGKNSSNTGHDRPIAHALPWQVGQLFLILYGLARPIAGHLTQRFHDQEHRVVQETSAFAIAGVEMSSSRLSILIQQFFEDMMGIDVGIRTLRHILTAVQKKRVPGASTLWDMMMSAMDTSGGHTSETVSAHYAVDIAQLHILADDDLLKYLFCSFEMLYQIFRALLTPTELRRLPGLRKAVGNQQETHSCTAIDQDSLVASMGAKLENIQEPFARRVAEVIMDRLDGREAIGPVAKPHQGPSQHNAAPVLPKHLALLRLYTGNQAATWSSIGQGKSIALVLQRCSSLLINLPTSAGKSFLFGSLPYIEPGITLVMFPLRAIMSDQLQASMQRQLALNASGRRAGRTVQFSEWSEENQDDGVVAVSAECMANNQAFRRWLDARISQARLNRIVLDEAHLTVTSESYRPVMGRLKYLTGKGVPLVALSATIPPHLESKVAEQVGLPTWQTVREGTQRSNIVYHIARYANEATATNALVRHVQRLTADLEKGEGFLVICRTIPDVLKVQSRLPNSTAYHGNLDGDNALKALNGYLAGNIVTLVGTTAAGTGVNKANCRAVFHLSPPRGIIDYMQETGRAGRDGKPALSIVFDWPGRPGPEKGANESSVHGWSILETDILDKANCIRQITSGWMDGNSLAVTCSGGVGFLACGRCSEAQRRLCLQGSLDLLAPDLPEESDLLAELPEREYVVLGLPKLATTPTLQQQLSNQPDHLDGASPLIQASMGPKQHLLPPGGLPGPSSIVPTKQQQTQAEQPRHSLNRPALLPALGVVEPVGHAIRRDAATARRREVEPRTEPETNLRATDCNQVYTLENIKRLTTFLHEKCIYCVFHNSKRLEHRLSECPRLPGSKGRNGEGAYRLLAFEKDGHTCEDLIGQISNRTMLPSDYTVCFTCLWPNNKRQGHLFTTVNGGPVCEVKDTVAQACWLYWCHPERFAKLQSHFPSLQGAVNNLPELAQWMCKVAHSEEVYKKKFAIYNMQRVVMYLVYVELTILV